MRRLLFALLMLSNFAQANELAMQNVEKIQTPAQAFVAQLVLRSGIKVISAVERPPKDAKVVSFFSSWKNLILRDLHLNTNEGFFVCRLKIRTPEFFHLVGCLNSKGDKLHRVIGRQKADLFYYDQLELNFPSGKRADFSGAMGVEITKTELRSLLASPATTGVRQPQRTGAH